MEEEQSKPLHIVMFPWLAIGHLRPFYSLSKYLARKGHLISFISTPRNLQRAIKVPKELSHLINLVSLPLPRVEHLPPDAESSMDVPHIKQQLLKVALDRLEPSVRSFLESTKPDWIVYDYATHWLPRLAEEYGIARAYFSLFTAAFMAFMGPPSTLISPETRRSTAEDYCVVPEWIPFTTTRMAFRLHEMTRNIEKDAEGNCYDSGTSDTLRFGLSIDGSDIVIFRSSIEFEPEWFDLLTQLYQKPIFSVGSLPEEEAAAKEANELTTNQEWSILKRWLDTKKENSVLYVALGTEAVLSQEEVHELAIGLEKCNLPFLWVLNRDHMHDMLPHGFSERVGDRGLIYWKWAPQVKILGHASVGGFLTHCGWNSATEALGFGKVLILFPVLNDQGLNARLLQDKRVGVEIPREERDGFFSNDEVAETVRFVMVSDEGREVRDNARKMKEVFGDVSKSKGCVESLVQYMMQRRRGHDDEDE